MANKFIFTEEELRSDLPKLMMEAIKISQDFVKDLASDRLKIKMCEMVVDKFIQHKISDNRELPSGRTLL